MSYKKLSRRDFLRMGTAGAAGLVLAACGGKDVEVTRVVTEKETISERVEPILIRMHSRCGPEAEHFGLFAQKYNDDHFPDVHVKMECFPGGEYHTKLKTMLAGATIGDAFWDASIGSFYGIAASGALSPLDEYVDAAGYDLGQIYDFCVEAARYEGKLYGLPQVAHPGRAGLFYSPSAFDDAGVDYPDDTWTYDDLAAAAKELTNPDEGAFGFFDPERSYFTLLVLVRAWGGDMLNEDGTKCTINSPEAVAALQYMSDLYNKDHSIPLPAQMAEGLWQMFVAKKIASYQMGFWGETAKHFVGPDDWAVAPMPLGPSGVRGGMFESDPVCMTAICEHKAETFEYLTYLASEESAWHNFNTGGTMSARPDVMTSEQVLGNKVMKVFAPALEYVGPLILPANLRITQFMKLIGERLSAVWLGEAVLEEVIDGIAQDAQTILDQPSLEA